MRLYIPLRFGYISCDSLAGFLDRMAARGWRFRSFRLGLEFERCEPSAQRYDVQVFLKNRESDMTPAPDTEEFAEYCRAAGWELVDSYRRFVVFRRLREDAAPIVTAQERLDTVFRAELGHRIRQLAAFCLLAVLMASYGLEVFFSNPLLLLAFCDLSGTVLNAGGLVALFLRRRRKQRELEKTGQARWETPLILPILRMIGAIIVIGAVVFVTAVELPMSLLYICVTIAVSLLLSFFRPRRDSNTVMTIVSVIIVISFLLPRVLYSNEDKLSNRHDSLENAPIRFVDLTGTNDPINCKYTKSSSVLGSMDVICASCHSAEYQEWLRTRSTGSVKPAGMTEEQTVWVKIYRSQLPWVIEKVYGRWTEQSYENAADQWGAEEAAHIVNTYNCNYFVRYRDCCFWLSVETPLSDSQIASIREGLGE